METCNAVQLPLAEEYDVGLDGVQPTRHCAELQQADIDSRFSLEKLERVPLRCVEMDTENRGETVLRKSVEKEGGGIVRRR